MIGLKYSSVEPASLMFWYVTWHIFEANAFYTKNQRWSTRGKHNFFLKKYVLHDNKQTSDKLAIITSDIFKQKN